MSILSIRAALETKLKAVYPVIKTAWEHKKFVPETGVPYQIVHVLLADVENPVQGNGMYRQAGVFQIVLAYPMGKGSKDIETRAELLRSTFYRGLSLADSGTTLMINRTPSIAAQPSERDRAITVVKVPFFAEIFN